ncbi:MAG: hypothetical protein AAGF84_07510 [Planctomycetota bacterium]
MSEEPVASDTPAQDFRHDARHRVLGYLLARGVTDRQERERWLERLFAEVESEDRMAFGSPQATVKAIDAYERLTAQDPESGDESRDTWLPEAKPKTMPRQPLGDLPAVLRGSFWSWPARWARPRFTRGVQPSVSPSESSDTDKNDSAVN